MEIGRIDYVSTSEAVEIAAEAGIEISRQAVVKAARQGVKTDGDYGIKKCRKSGGVWLIHRESLIEYLNNRRVGRPPLKD